MRNKKKGASLVVVTIVMGILFTSATAILGLTASDYKMRINESKKIENLYASDSGLDVTYNIIAKTTQVAISNSTAVLKEELSVNTETEENIKEKINDEFKKNFIEFLGKDENGNLAKAIVNNEVPKLKNDSKSIENWESIEKKSTIKIGEYLYTDNTITVTVESSFKTESTDNVKFKNEKKVRTTYVIEAPDYNDSFTTESELVTVPTYPIFNEKIITADGNLELQGNANLKGDIWVKGNEDTNILDLSYDKYKNGILFKDGNIKLDGNIFTSKTLNLSNKAKLDVAKNIYAFNTYLGKSKRGLLDGTDLNLKTKDMILINDLALNTNVVDQTSGLGTSNVEIENFYGINKVVENPTTANMALESSSIIVNDFGAALNITNSAYISGVAYIDTNSVSDNGDKYQTAESVAVKGNYKAYTEVLPGYEDKVTIKYYNPLQLIETINEDGSVKAKSDYFIEYYNKNKTINSAGISLPNNTYAAGVYVSNGTVANNSISIDDQKNIIDIKKKSYDDYVENMGLEDDKKNVINKINWKELNNVNKELLNHDYGKIILNSDENKKIEIVDNRYNGELLDKVLIISKGDVIIDGDINITGNIITAKNVKMKASKNQNSLTYNEEDTLKMIASNYDLLKNIFEGVEVSSQTVNVGDKIIIDSDSSQYEVKSYLTSKNWSILK